MSVLERIVANTREEVAERRARRPLASFVDTLVPSARSFLAALQRPGLSLIAEIKARSPSSPERTGPAFDPGALAAAYDASAQAISVLTDGRFFGGAHAHLETARRATRRPLLCKDFVVDPEYQIPEARSFGADAILLMAQVLPAAEIERALAIARALGMEPLVEVHDDDQLARILGETSARIIGINARDLSTLAIDLLRPLRWADLARSAGKVVVAESGIRGPDDVRRVEGRVDAILVGTALASAPDPAEALAALGFAARRPCPEVKICGVRTLADAREAEQAGARYVGLNFVPGGRREILGSEAQAIGQAGLGVNRVGIFVSPSVGEVAAAIELGRLDTIQIHGPADLAPLAELCASRSVALWRAVAVDAAFGPGRLDEARAVGARTVLDGDRSGAGMVFDATPLRGLLLPSDLILAGGLTPDNVAERTAQFEPAIVDVASGIEENGLPSSSRMTAFVAAASGDPRKKGFDAAPDTVW